MFKQLLRNAREIRKMHLAHGRGWPIRTAVMIAADELWRND